MPDPGGCYQLPVSPGTCVFPQQMEKETRGGAGRASESKRAAGDRQGLQAGATSTEEWTDRPTKSPERQGQDRAPAVQ